MDRHEIFMELDSIHSRYERLASLVDLLYIMASEMMDVAGIPEDCLSNVLHEVRLGLAENNRILKEILDGREESHEK